MSLDALVKKRKKINLALLILLVLLVMGLFYSVKTEFIKYLNFISPKSQATTITINQSDNSIQLIYENNSWQMQTPYQQRASSTVVNALLGKISTRCNQISTDTKVNSDTFASIDIDNTRYTVGELNPVNDKVYVSVKNNNDRDNINDITWMLCDKTIAAIALAPAINFIERRLYIGDIRSIKGSFAEITINNQLEAPLDVLEIVEISKDKINNVIDTIIIQGNQGSMRYQVMLNDDGKHLLLSKADTTDNQQNTQFIYVIKATPALLNIIGL